MSAFVTVATEFDIGKDFAKRLMREGFTIDDAAVAYLDAVITALRRASGPNIDEDVRMLISDMEAGLDRIFLNKPGKVIPRNGSAGPQLAEFASDGGR